MAEVREITVSFSKKVQVEQYEPVDVVEEVTVEIEDGDDWQEVAQEFHDDVQDDVKQQIFEEMNSFDPDGD